jgi:hypothetical protein
MKYRMFVLALAVTACIPGCQENAVDPFTESAAPSLEKAVPVPVIDPIVIPINTVLHDPRLGFNDLVLLAGQVQCILTSETDANSRLATYVVTVDQTVAIEVTPFGDSSDPGGKISGGSLDNVTVPYGQSGLLQKAYKVSWNSNPGLAGNLTLNMVFEVTSTGITLSELWLTTIPISQGRVDY